MTYRARKNLVVTITALLLAAMVISLVSSAVLAQSEDESCGIGSGGTFGCDAGGGGGENPPDDGGGGGGRDPDDGGGGGSGSDGGGGSGGDGGGGDVGSDDSVPTPQPTPVPWYETVTFYCTTWPTCPEGWANVVGQRNPAGRFYANDVTCLTEDDCISSDDGSDDDDDFPCDYPPTIEGGIIHQPCDEWPGWFIEAEVTIPPARVLRHPWPRGLVNWPNEYWFAGTAPEPEAWSNKAKECPAASAGDTGGGTFDCNGGVGSATQGAKVNYQIGVAWRRWTPGDGDIFGYSPPDHVSWTIQDRDGSHMLFGPHVSYTFETSSWGQPRRGPVWNEECQDRECSYDERVASPTGSPAYPVGVTTYWYPEWNIRWLEYECNREDCDCTCVTGSGSDQCSGPSGHCILDNEYWKQDCECVEWKWNRTSDGWTTYDLRPLGLDPVIPWNAAVTAGADENGHRQGSWIDAQPWTPIIEVQPVGAHTGDE
jgi:hypothetical protein